MKNIVCFPKSYFLALILLIGISLNSYAQSQSTREKIESMRVAYITNKISLSTEEAQTLWPIYNAYQAEMQQLREKTNLSDLQREEAELEVKKRYNEKFRKAIPNKLEDFYAADKEFKRMLIERMRDN